MAILGIKKEKTLCDDNAKEIKLSYSEIVILDLLLCNPDQIFSNSDFFYTIQSHSFDQELSADSIKSAIKRIRKKLPPETIENIYGQGYRIKKEI
jgi:DNA-binding response OmpR family regulator